MLAQPWKAGTDRRHAAGPWQEIPELLMAPYPRAPALEDEDARIAQYRIEAIEAALAGLDMILPAAANVDAADEIFRWNSRPTSPRNSSISLAPKRPRTITKPSLMAIPLVRATLLYSSRKK
jgi:hypothetical protein